MRFTVFFFPPFFGGTTRKNNNNNNNNNNYDSSTFDSSREMVEMLNRCLDSWRKVTSSTVRVGVSVNNVNHPHNLHPPLEAMRLMNLFHDASESLNDKDLRPNRKTYSMCMNVLALYPESSTACDDIISLLERARRNTIDLQLYNVCLHTLAKFGTHHEEAPILVERIFQEMTTTTDLYPNTACFVSLLHAWANTIKTTSTTTTKVVETTPSAADRAEAILDQMINNYPQLVDTICFNICIDAWGKQGCPEKAEKVLLRLHKHYRTVKSGNDDNDDDNDNVNDNDSSIRRNKVRPNAISFNSAINAWAKSGGSSSRNSSSIYPRRRDPQEAADRAGRLLEQMKLQGYEPTSETFGTVMEAYSNTPNPGAKVQNLLDELEKMYSEGSFSLPPPKVCYLPHDHSSMGSNEIRRSRKIRTFSTRSFFCTT